uniref:TOX high mobility group box family member 3-like isoform X2 n=1 Tax=Myxine glutinosa TaxID=7769 RepID=UPI00358FE62A
MFGNNYMNMTDPSFLSTTETFHTPSLGDEVLEIPPIGSLPEGDPAALGMVEAVQGFVGLDDGMTGTQGADFAPHFPPQSLELPAITISGGLLAQDHGMLGMSMAPSDPSPVYMHGVHMSVGPVLSAQERPPPIPTLMHAHGALTTIDQSHLRAQLGLGLGSGAGMPHGSPSPPGSQSATPSPSSSLNDEDPEELNRLAMEKRQMVDLNRKAKTNNKKKKKAKDPNEPQKPVSAYALFFRDTQAAIKGQNSSATFGEVSKIVASMWDSLGEEQKQVYKRKTEAAKKEYLKALSAYRDGLLSQTGMDGSDMDMMSHQNQAPAHSVASQMLAASAPMPPPLHPMPQVASKLTAAGQMSVAMSSMPPPPPLMTAPHYQQRLVAAQQQQQQMLMEPHSLLQQQQQQQQHQQQMMVSQQMPPPPTPPLQPQPMAADQPMLLHQQQQQQTIVVQSHESQSLHLQEMPEESHPSQHLVAEVDAGIREDSFPPNQVVTMDIANTTCANSMSAIQASSSDVRQGSEDIMDDGQIAGGEQMLAQDSRGTGLIGEVEMTSVASPVQAYPQNFSPAEALMVPSPHRATPPEMCALPKCVRMGCSNPPVASVDWDNEFCSSECVVSHCRDVFMAWVASRVQSSPASVK